MLTITKRQTIKKSIGSSYIHYITFNFEYFENLKQRHLKGERNTGKLIDDWHCDAL